MEPGGSDASDTTGPTAVDNSPFEFDCPRCTRPVSETFYGPCGECRAVLRATVRGEAHEVAATDYEPKMNVTPNAVALKD